jgi:hypothetical protein
MSNEIKVTQQHQITEDVTIRHQEVQVGLHVYSKVVRQSLMVNGKAVTPSQPYREHEGMVDDENLRDLLAGNTFHTCGEAFKIMPDWIRQVIAKRGVRHWEREGDPTYLLNPGHGVYEALVKDAWGIEDLVRFGMIGGQRILLSSTGNPLPSGIECSSERGLFDDRLYDIEKLFDHIRQRPDVVFFDRYGGQYDAEPAIHKVVGGDERCVNFVWEADAATLMRIYEASQDMMEDDRPDPAFWEVAFEIDALGLRAAGCAKRDTFFVEQEPRPAAPGRR